MTHKTILIVDADSEATEDMVATLESDDYLVFTASTGEMAIAMVTKVKPSLILINPAIAGVGGLELCTTLHKMDESVPLLALSSFEGEMDPRYRTEYGIVDFLKVPATSGDLSAKVAGLLSETPMGKAAVEKGERAEGPAFAGKPGETDRIVVRVKEKAEGRTEEPLKEEAPEDLVPPSESGEFERKEEGKTIVAKRPLQRRRSMGDRLTVPLIAVGVLIVLAAGGAVAYKMGLIPGTGAKKPAVAKLPEPAPKEPLPVPSPQEQKAPEIPPQAKAPVPSATPMPAPTPEAKPAATSQAKAPEKKPAAKPTYSVQIGAFKSEQNAEALAKQFKGKGYDAFVQSIPKDKEMVHRVLVGKFQDRKEAGKLAVDIKNKENVSAIVTGE